MALFRVRVLFAIFVVSVFCAVVNCEDAEQKTDIEESEGRTFGHHFLKRMSFAVLPIMYKMGMMTTLMITLTIMSTKGLAVGVLLLVLAISQIISRSLVPVTSSPVAAIPAPYAAYAQPAIAQPAVYPVVYSRAEVPAVVHKVATHTAHVGHVGHAPAAYGGGWHNPYAREGVEDDQTEFQD